MDFFHYAFNNKDQIGKGSGEDRGIGRVSTAICTNIASTREPSIFDTEEIRQRDQELFDIEKLRQSDIELHVTRKDKPVVLTSSQTRLVYALSYAITQNMDEEALKERIRNPFYNDNHFSVTFNITSLSILQYGSARKRYKEKIIEDLKTLGSLHQVIHLKIDGEPVRFTAPLIMIGNIIEDLSKGKQANLDYMQVIFGGAFFHLLDKRYAVITPRLFEAWRKGGRGTELFGVLLSSILSVYWRYKQAATDAENNVRNNKENKSLPPSEIEELVADAKRAALAYELNVDTIKKKVTTDYDEKRSHRARFYSDLNNAIDGLKEARLITEGKLCKGARSQEKVVFILSENYSTEQNVTPKLEVNLLDKSKPEGEEEPKS